MPFIKKILYIFFNSCPFIGEKKNICPLFNGIRYDYNHSPSKIKIEKINITEEEKRISYFREIYLISCTYKAHESTPRAGVLYMSNAQDTYSCFRSYIRSMDSEFKCNTC